MKWPEKKSRLDEVFHPLLEERQVRLFMLRDDLLHPGISGNKWRKLKFNIQKAWELSAETLITVGGFHSNHIAAVAHAGKIFGFKTVGLVQGYSAQPESPTIKQAKSLGMDIQLLDKSAFKQAMQSNANEWKRKYDNAYFIPMGGGNLLGVKGCVEIAHEIHPLSTHVTSSCGTGSTLAGIALGAKNDLIVQGFTPFKNGSFLRNDIQEYLDGYPAKQQPAFELITSYAGGKFGSLPKEMAIFIEQFYTDTHIALDGIYNGKMMFGIFDLLRQGGYPKNSVITAIHTGGVQGNAGLNAKYGYNLPELH